MWNKKGIVRAGAAIIATLAGWGLIRLLFPSLDYYPPESLTRVLERSWFVTTGLRKLAMASYALVALIVMTVLFNVVQQRWPGRGDLKGLAFVTFHALGATLLADLFGPASSLLFVPTNPLQFALLTVL